MDFTGNTVLITGGASGIGLALAQAFQSLGNTVIVAGRRQALLDEVTTANPGLVGYVLDVESVDSIAAFAETVTRAHPDLNVLINNAGIMRAENLAADPPDLRDAEATITTNLLGPIRLIAALFRHLQGKPHATIINVTSGLSFVPLALAPTYSATKAAMHSYTMSLRHQLRETNIEVLELAPPLVATDLMPGQAANPRAMPLNEFISETMALLQNRPSPAEILVDRVNFQRRAEAEGRFEQAFNMVNGVA